MKWRRLLIGWRLWYRTKSANRLAKRLERQITALQSIHASELLNLRQSYENKLAIERAEKQALLFQFADRLLEYHKLRGISYAIAEAKTQAESETMPQAAETLDMDERMFLDEMRENFWKDGIAEGKSEASIAAAWESFKPQAIATTKAEFMLHDN